MPSTFVCGLVKAGVGSLNCHLILILSGRVGKLNSELSRSSDSEDLGRNKAVNLVHVGRFETPGSVDVESC